MYLSPIKSVWLMRNHKFSSSSRASYLYRTCPPARAFAVSLRFSAVGRRQRPRSNERPPSRNSRLTMRRFEVRISLHWLSFRLQNTPASFAFFFLFGDNVVYSMRCAADLSSSSNQSHIVPISNRVFLLSSGICRTLAVMRSRSTRQRAR